jgi:signal transduction histidine kinase
VLLPENEVKQILYNLIRNAIEASPPQSEVSISIERGRREVAVRISDQGEGISEEILSRVFEPFFSTKQGSSKPGLGLGLSVSRSLIEAIGGRIEVKSELGAGSVFSAVFPRRLSATGGGNE